ncbi:MAG: LLM class flavin-dependent oxidoreductase [Pseudomonadota bacterium]|nr:LLM class flavin-dependent oxidoreductase [Pseudomonadota bacterium]
MKNAVYSPNFGSFGCVNKLVELAVLAENSGFDGFFLWDHINITGNEALDTVDPIVALAAIASATSKISLGPIVTPLARRRPWKVSRELVSLDHLSKGRVIFGAGLGEPPEFEFTAFGEDSSAKVRAKKVDESLTLIDRLSSGQKVEFQGDYYKVDNVQFNPIAYQKPRFPIWIAATLPATAGLKRSMNWNGVFPVSRPSEDVVNPGWNHWLPSYQEFEKVIEYGKKNLGPQQSSQYDYVASVILGQEKVKGTPVADFKNIGATWMFHWIDESIINFDSTVKFIKSGKLSS